MLYNIAIPVVFLVLCGTFLTFLLLFAEKKIINYGLCKILINRERKKIVGLGGSSLLSFLVDNNIFIPSACGGRGSCAYCKVKVLQGSGPLTPVEKSILSSVDIEKGIRLSCQVKVRNDIKIEIPDELFNVKKYKAVLLKKVFLTSDIVELSIKIIDPNFISFEAGQYIQLESEEYMGRDSVMRAYSLSSSPYYNDHVKLIIRKVPDGICTTWIFKYLSEGLEFYFSGPYGNFAISDTNASIIFIAGGSGMAPMWSMLQNMIYKKNKRKVIYFFGALGQDDLFYQNRLWELSKNSDWFEFVPALSNEPDSSSWKGKRGLITDVVRQSIPLNVSDYEAYLCGSPGMIEACISVLTNSGMLESNVYYDKFT